MRTPRTAIRVSAYGVVLLLAAGCGTTQAATPSAGGSAGAASSAHEAEGHDKGHEKGHDKGPDTEHAEGHAGAHGDGGQRSGPSEAAAMICTDEIAEAVRRSFDLEAVPERHDTWEAPHYQCDYHVGGSRLHVSVHDAEDAAAGRAYFRDTRGEVPGVATIKGVKSFGFPAFESPDGLVGMMKDGKTLLFDAQEVPAGDLPRGFTRTEVAYSVAAAVMGCWTE